MEMIIRKKVLEEVSNNDDLENLIYTIIDACPYDFESIPAIASFKYLSFYDKITQTNKIRYFSKMYELIDLLCHYKKLIENLQINNYLDEDDLFKSCQISAIRIYKSTSLKENSGINNRKLAFCLNAILNEFFEESFTSKLKEDDILKNIKKKTEFKGFDIFEFV